MKYEYAVQWRWKGENDDGWAIVLKTFDLSGAKKSRERFIRDYPDSETRIVRRPIEWEVVE